MQTIVKTFPELSTEELYEILRTREAVFIVEQNCPYPEADGRDYDAVHLFCRGGDGRVKAYLRLYAKKDEPGTVQVGRVVTTERGTGLGRRILSEGVRYAIAEMGARELYLEAQVYAVGFYEKEGFRVCSEEFLEDGIPHVAMRRKAVCGS
ncbi:MAG: GNAT family N-acetyltransferase [Bacteroidales bacterium]|nr:GNAT family N-acetyltransferase [Bacteroidales bacterium]